MRMILRLLIVVFIASVSATFSFAQGHEDLNAPIDERRLYYGDIRIIQTALAFEGYYKGMIDGEWGEQSAKAFRQYTWNEHQSIPRKNLLVALVVKFLEDDNPNNWNYLYDPLTSHHSFLLPLRAMDRTKQSAEYVLQNWEHTLSSLRLTQTRGNFDQARKYHEFAAEAHYGPTEQYRLRRNKTWVTSVQKRDGTLLYVRSDLIYGHWSTLIVSAAPRHRNIFSAVTSSITPKQAPKLEIAPRGYLAQLIDATKVQIEKDRSPPPTQPSPAPAPAPKAAPLYGTGFYVSVQGDILTNAHVVQDCERITIQNGQQARLITRSEQFDLALLRDAVALRETPFAHFSLTPAQLNSDVTVMGFPLNGLLSGLNVTRGSVSAVAGLENDMTRMQITAPVQPGNSGGPVMNQFGDVVGVVVSKLNAQFVANEIGDIPQNVNFAIRSEIARLFLLQNGVSSDAGTTKTSLAPEELAKRARDFTVLITCHR